MANIVDVPWLEKYRPKDLSDVLGNDEIIERLKVFSKCGNFPNIILSGAPGIGKTTSILCLARTLLGEHFKNAVLELNASNERGIDVIRGQIKSFAHQKLTLPAHCHKIIILDEADSLTEGAQQALRRTMEVYSDTTRFALACNTSDKIIEPIQSRCAILRFKKLSDQQILQRILQVVEKENITTTDDGLEALVFTAQGDMRQAINNLQATYSAYSVVNSENVYKVCDEPPPKKVESLLKLCIEGDVVQATCVIKAFWDKGYSASDILANIMRYAKSSNIFAEHTRLNFLKCIALTQMDVAKGNTTLIQLTGLVASLCQLYSF